MKYSFYIQGPNRESEGVFHRRAWLERTRAMGFPKLSKSFPCGSPTESVVMNWREIFADHLTQGCHPYSFLGLL